MGIVWAVGLVVVILLLVWSAHHLALAVILILAVLAMVGFGYVAFFRLSARRSRVHQQRFPYFLIDQRILAQHTVISRQDGERKAAAASEAHWARTLDGLRERVLALKELINSIDRTLGLSAEFELAEPAPSGPRPARPLPVARPYAVKRLFLRKSWLPWLHSNLAATEGALAAAEAAYAKAHRPKKKAASNGHDPSAVVVFDTAPPPPANNAQPDPVTSDSSGS